MNGTAAIVASGGEVVMQIEGDLKVSIPFFGKKVEPEIAKGIYAAVDKEQKTAATRLPCCRVVFASVPIQVARYRGKSP